MNGSIVPWAEATVHVRTDMVMRGGSVFEGIRAYLSQDGANLNLFRLDDHLTRLAASAKVLRMEIPWGPDEIASAIQDLVTANGFNDDLHIRPQAYYGMGSMYGVGDDIEVGMAITAVQLASHQVGGQGAKAVVSSWTRIDDASMPPRVKASANYLNGRLAVTQARGDGYDVPILLNRDGKVAESPGACVVAAFSGRLITPPATAGSLDSITRRTMIEIAENLGIEVLEREMDRTELYQCDELLLCGTAVEITPVTSVDRILVGDGTVGKITMDLSRKFDSCVRGVDPMGDQWLTPVRHGQMEGQGSN